MQTKRRPAVVLSSAAYHEARPDVIVGLVTSQTSKSSSPTNHLILDWRAAGLRVPSAFRAFIVTLPRTAVVHTMGTLTAADRGEIVKRLTLAIDLTSPRSTTR